jgi:type IV pilus assembly protein PilM
MSFLSRIVRGGTAIGIDVGTTSIKVAEVGKSGDRLELRNYGMIETSGYLERVNEALQSSALQLSEETLPGYLRLVLDRAKIGAREAVASIPAFHAFSTLIEVPAMSDGDLRKVMENQAKQYVSIPLSQVSLDWMRVGTREVGGEEKHQVLLISVPNDEIERYRAVFKRAGLALTGIEVEGVSLARALTAGEKGHSLLIDIGSRSTFIGIAEDGKLKVSSQTDFAGGSITQVIANGLAISPKRAEDLKRQRGLQGYGGEHELSTLIEPTIDVILGEAKRLMGTFETNYQSKVERVMLSGGGSNLLGLEAYVAREVGMPTLRANPFRTVYAPDALSPITKVTGPLLAVALGLASRET